MLGLEAKNQTAIVFVFFLLLPLRVLGRILSVEDYKRPFLQRRIRSSAQTPGPAGRQGPGGLCSLECSSVSVLAEGLSTVLSAWPRWCCQGIPAGSGS